MPNRDRREPSFRPEPTEGAAGRPLGAGPRIAATSDERPGTSGRFVVPGLCVAVLAVLVGYPLLNESSGSMCGALERRVLTLQSASQPRRSGDAFGTALAGAFANAVSNGFVASAVLKQRYPDVPPVLACTVGYWNLMLDPAAAQAFAVQPTVPQ
jgi:hypothetical protein